MDALQLTRQRSPLMTCRQCQQAQLENCLRDAIIMLQVDQWMAYCTGDHPFGGRSEQQLKLQLEFHCFSTLFVLPAVVSFLRRIYLSFMPGNGQKWFICCAAFIGNTNGRLGSPWGMAVCHCDYMHFVFDACGGDKLRQFAARWMSGTFSLRCRRKKKCGGGGGCTKTKLSHWSVPVWTLQFKI